MSRKGTTSINTYNTERLHSALDYLTPDEAYYEGSN